MTVVAWDGRTMAADRQGTSGGFRRATTKLHVVPDGIIASSGSGIACVAMHEWFKAGRQTSEWPKIQNSGEKDCVTMFVDWSGQLWLYENFPHPIKVENRYDAIGSGRDFALAAMELGHDAIMAVDLACRLDTGCGMGLNFLHLEIERNKQKREVKCT